MIDPYDPLPPAPTQAQLWDRDYRYLGCTKMWCCGGTRQDLIAEWVIAGCPPGWHHQFTNLAIAGYTATQVAEYAPPKSWENASGLGVLSHLFEYLREGVPANDVYDFHIGYIHHGDNILTLHRLGCRPDTVIDYVPAVMATDENTVHVGASFTSKYETWATAGASADMIAAFLADRPPLREVGPAVNGWTETGLSPDSAVRLHRAGITPAEVAANPDLATADSRTLAVMAALR